MLLIIKFWGITSFVTGSLWPTCVRLRSEGTCTLPPSTSPSGPSQDQFVLPAFRAQPVIDGQPCPAIMPLPPQGQEGRPYTSDSSWKLLCGCVDARLFPCNWRAKDQDPATAGYLLPSSHRREPATRSAFPPTLLVGVGQGAKTVAATGELIDEILRLNCIVEPSKKNYDPSQRISVPIQFLSEGERRERWKYKTK